MIRPWTRPVREYAAHLREQPKPKPVESSTPPLAQLVSERREAGVQVVAWHVRGGGR